MSSVAGTYLADIKRTYRNYQSLADRAVAQVSDSELVVLIDPDALSIALIMQHVAGNLISRFTDFLTADGEKPTRDRDAEFEGGSASDLPRIRQRWADAWRIVLNTLDQLTIDDLERTVTIRGESFAVVEALNRSATHTAYHVGQIVFLAKHFTGAGWTSLSIPKGKSKDVGVGTFKNSVVPSGSN
jgi:hypothetical protein